MFSRAWRVVIKPNALARMMELMREMETEFGFELDGFTKEDERTVVIEDIFVPSQIASLGHFSVTKEGYGEIARKFPEPSIGWGHSHGTMSAFHSTLDRQTDGASNLVNNGVQVSLTISERLGSWDCVLYEDAEERKCKLVFADVSDEMKKIRSPSIFVKMRDWFTRRIGSRQCLLERYRKSTTPSQRKGLAPRGATQELTRRHKKCRS